jgi:uncharacterized phage protein gp47/JayE
MAWQRPNLSTLISRVLTDIQSKLEGTTPLLRRSNLNILGKVVAAATHGLYGYLDWIAKQVIYDTAEEGILDRWAIIWLKTPRVAAAYAIGQITVTGTNGTLLPAGTVFIRADGIEYETDLDGTIAEGIATIDITAIEAGQAGNAQMGVTLNIASPIAGVNATATVAAGGLFSGADEESDDQLRRRLRDRIQQPPQGGSKHDYVSWALEVPGVTRAWCSPGELGEGTVTVRFVRDNDANLIPDAGEVAAVQAYIDDLRPVTAALTVVSPEAVALNFEIDLLDNDTADIRAAVEAELRDLLLREAEPERGNGEGNILLSHIREAISIANGEKDHELTIPAGNVTHTTGQMAVFGAITWL